MPPGIDEMSWWRIVVSGTLFGLVAIMLLHLAHACGWGPFAGEGFAQAADVTEVLIAIKEEKIVERQRDFCSAEPGSRSKDFFLERRNVLLREYRDLSGRPYEGLPTCEELGLD